MISCNAAWIERATEPAKPPERARTGHSKPAGVRRRNLPPLYFEGPLMMHADAALARRLERAEADNARDCSGVPGSEILEIGGGMRHLRRRRLSLDAGRRPWLERSCRGRGAEPDRDIFPQPGGQKVSIDLCPLADPSWLGALNARGYRPADFNNVLVKRLAGVEITLTPRVRRAVAGETDLWSHTVGHGFFDQSELTDAEMDVGRAIFSMAGALCYLAVSEAGEPAGGAAAAMRNGLATLFADSTIVHFRRGGFHRELIAARLNEAIAQECDLATASTLPGSGSQRNYERLGFEVVYTRVTMVR